MRADVHPHGQIRACSGLALMNAENHRDGNETVQRHRQAVISRSTPRHQPEISSSFPPEGNRHYGKSRPIMGNGPNDRKTIKRRRPG